MSLYLPPEMRWLGWIAGAEWPDGDEDNAWAVSGIWEEAAEELLGLLDAVDAAKAATMAAYSDGAARAEMGALYDRMRSGDSSLETLAQYLQQTSDSTFDMGTELQAEKITIIVTLCWLAVEIALAWLFPPTAPAVEAAAVGTSRAILQAVRTATQKAIQQLAAKLGAPNVKRSFWRSLLAGKPVLPTAKGWGVVGSEVVQGAAEEAMISGAVQAGQVADDKRRDMDWSEIGYSAAAGGFAEPIGGAVAKGLNKGFAGGFGIDGLAGRLDNWWGRAGQNTVVGAASDGLAGIAGSLFVAGISGQSISDTLTGIGVAGGFIQGGLVGLADPSSFGRIGFSGPTAGWGAAGGHSFGRSGNEFDNNSGDGSGTGEQVRRLPPGGAVPPPPTRPQGFAADPPPAGEDAPVSNRSPSGGAASGGTDSRGADRSFAAADSGLPVSPGQSSQNVSGTEPWQTPAGNGVSPGGVDFAGASSDSAGRPAAPVDSSSGLAPSGGRSAESLPGTAGGTSSAPAATGEGTESNPGGSSAGKQGPTFHSPDAGGEGGVVGSEDGQGAGGSRDGGVAGPGEGWAVDEIADGSGVGGANGGDGRGGPTGGEAGPGGSDTATRQDPQVYRDGPAEPDGTDRHERAGTDGRQSGEPGTHPGDRVTGPSSGEQLSGRAGGTPDSGAWPSQTGGSPVPQVPGPVPSAPAQNLGSPQAPGAGQTPAVPQHPAAVSGGSASNSTPAQTAGGGQSSGSRPEAATGQSSSAARSTADTGPPRQPGGGGPETSVDAEWADLLGGELPGDVESTWTPQAFEAVLSTHEAGDTGSPARHRLWAPAAMPSGPAAPPMSPAQAPAAQPGPQPVSNQLAPVPGANAPGAPAPNQSLPSQSSPNQPQAGPGQAGADSRHGQAGPGQAEAGPSRAQAGGDQSGAHPSGQGDTGRPKRAHSETEASPQPPLKRQRAEAAGDSAQQGEQETASAEGQPVPVLVPVDSGPQQQSPAQQGSRASRSPRDSGAEQSTEDSGAEQSAEESDWEGWTDPESEAETGPEAPLLGRREPPVVLGNPVHSRVYGPGLLAPLEDPQLQRDLEDALRGADGNFVRYADPRTHPAGATPYGLLVNPEIAGSRSRGNNCAETALAGLAGFLGVPMVAAPRFPDVVGGIVDSRGGEQGSPQRVFQMLRTGQESYHDGRPVEDQYIAIDNWLRHLGPGSAAYVTHMWKQIDPATGQPYPDDGSVLFEAHATLIVYPEGAEGPVWWDPQSGEMTLGPAPDMVERSAGVAFIPVPAGRIIAPDPEPAALPAPVPHRPPAGPVVRPNARSTVAPPSQLPDPVTSRTFGPGNSNPVLHPGSQQVLENALGDGAGGFVAGAHPGTYPSTAAPYGSLVNAGGPETPGRRTNHFDAALSALSSFLGRPRVAAARYPDSTEPAETDGYQRVARWAGVSLHSFPPNQVMTRQFENLHNWVHHLGPGSAALVLSVVPERDPVTGAIARDLQSRPVGRAHPTVVVYPPSAAGPVWWNAVTGATWDGPPADLVAITGKLGFIPLPPGRTIGEESPAGTTPLPLGPAGTQTESAARQLADTAEVGESHYPDEGAIDGSAVADSGPGARISAGGATGRPPVSGRPYAGGRLAPATGAVPGTGGDGRGDRNVVSGGERGYRGDVAVSEPAGPDGDGRLHRSGDERPDSVGPPDLSSADPDRTTPAGGDFEAYRVSGRGPFGAETGRAVLDGDRQENPATAADDQRRDGGRGLGGVAAGTGRGVAGDGHHGVLNPAGPPAAVARYTPEQSALIPQPAHDRNPARWGRPESAGYQTALEDVVRDGEGGFVQFAHPATAAPGGRPLIELINGPGISARGRDDNCEDAVLSLLATFLGKPQVAAPAIGPHERDMGNRGQARAERLLGSHLVRYDDGSRTIADQYQLAHDRIAALGPGAMAYVVAVWQGHDDNGQYRPAGSHAFAVVFPDGAEGPVWCDPQVGRIADKPFAGYVRETGLVGFVISTPQRVLAAAETRADLESALSDGNGGFAQYADPRSYRKLITGHRFRTGGRVSMYRAGIAGVASFLGSPRFAAPAWNDIEADGGPRARDELHEEGRTEVEHFFQKSMRTLDDGRRTITRQLDLIHQRVVDLGPESAALVEVSHRRGTQVVADACLLLVYPAGPASVPVWWDPVGGAIYRHAAVTMLLDEPTTDSILYVTATAPDLLAGNLSTLLAAPARHGFSGNSVTDPQTWTVGASSEGSPDAGETPQAHAALGPAAAPLLAPEQLTAISESEREPGRWGELENFQFQLDIETAISDDNDNSVAFRHPGDDSVPGGYPYIELINGGGMADPGRSENCEDCVAALLSTFLGTPRAARPVVGPPGRDQGSHGIAKAERFLGSQAVFFGWEGQSVAQQYRSAHDRIADLGPGALADVSLHWHDTDDHGNKRYRPDGTPVPGDEHAMAVVFPEGASGPVWCDPQSGRTYDFPTQTMIDSTLRVSFVISTPQRVVQAAEQRAALTAALDDGAGGFAAFRHPGSYKQLIVYNRFDPARCQHSIYRVGIAAAATFLGRPRFAAPSWNELNTGGRPSIPDILDIGGRRDVAEFFQAPLSALHPADAPMAEQLDFLHGIIQQPPYGPGSVMFVELTHSYDLPGADAYGVADQVLLLVFPESGPAPAEPVWWDPLVGAVYSHDGLITTVAADATAMRFVAATAETLINGNFVPTPVGSAVSSPAGSPSVRSGPRAGGDLAAQLRSALPGGLPNRFPMSRGPNSGPREATDGASDPPPLPAPEQTESVRFAVSTPEQRAAAADGSDRFVAMPSPRYRGHGRIQRRRPIEWVLPTGFQAPDAPESWLPDDSVAAGPSDEPGGAENGPVAGELPDVDIPFTLGADPGPE